MEWGVWKTSLQKGGNKRPRPRPPLPLPWDSRYLSIPHSYSQRELHFRHILHTYSSLGSNSHQNTCVQYWSESMLLKVVQVASKGRINWDVGNLLLDHIGSHHIGGRRSITISHWITLYYVELKIKSSSILTSPRKIYSQLNSLRWLAMTSNLMPAAEATIHEIDE
jgi:hypothetical protein